MSSKTGLNVAALLICGRSCPVYHLSDGPGRPQTQLGGSVEQNMREPSGDNIGNDTDEIEMDM